MQGEVYYFSGRYYYQREGGFLENPYEKEIVKILIEKGNKKLNKNPEKVEYAENPKADALLNDIENYPHAIVLACLMSRRIKSEKSCLIPYEVSREINGFEFEKLEQLSLEQLKGIFNREKLHIYNDKMAEVFYEGIQKIKEVYNGNASNIWKDCPSSATIVRRFLEFKGVGIKIATMTANILVRDFKIPMKDHTFIDVSPDVHVKRVFKRLGLVSENAGRNEIIYRAREYYPKYSGIFNEKEAKLALSYAEHASLICSNVRGEVWKRAQ